MLFSPAGGENFCANMAISDVFQWCGCVKVATQSTWLCTIMQDHLIRPFTFLQLALLLPKKLGHNRTVFAHDCVSGKRLSGMYTSACSQSGRRR